MTNKLIIFGGGGFIGSTYFLEYGNTFNQVVVIDWFNKPTHSDRFLKNRLHQGQITTENLTIIEGDIFEEKYYAEHLIDATHLLILNADTGTGISFLTPYHSTNYNSNILSFLIEKIKKYNNDLSQLSVIFTSSRAVYGEGVWACSKHGEVEIYRSKYLAEKNISCPFCAAQLTLTGTCENDRTDPLSVYGANKLFSENLLKLLLVDEVRKLIILRPQNVYGLGQSRRNPYTGLINWFSESLINHEDIEIYEQGLIIRDFIEIRDVTRAIQMCFFNCDDNFDVFNLGSGVPTTLIELAEVLKEIFNSNSEIKITDKYRKGDVIGALSNNQRIQSKTSFSSQIGLREGLKRYSDWFIQ